MKQKRYITIMLMLTLWLVCALPVHAAYLESAVQTAQSGAQTVEAVQNPADTTGQAPGVSDESAAQPDTEAGTDQASDLPEIITLTVGATQRIAARNATDGGEWHVENPDIAAVDKTDADGVDITAKSPGVTTLTRGAAETFTVVVNKQGYGTITFNPNGAGGTAPAAISAPIGSAVTMPGQGNMQKGNTVFSGWSTFQNYTLPNGYKHNKYNTGDAFIIDSAAVTLYAVWADWGNASTPVKFFIRMDGSIPDEPSSNQGDRYSKEISLPGVLNLLVFWSNPNGIGVGPYSAGTPNNRLNKVPSIAEIENAVNTTTKSATFPGMKGEYRVRLIEDTLYLTTNTDPKQAVDKDGNPLGEDATDQEIKARGVPLYVQWYVIKRQSKAWHVDGVLLRKNMVNIVYEVNAPSGSVKNMPLGTQVEKGGTVYAGCNSNDPNAPLAPERIGYVFDGWRVDDPVTGTKVQNGDNLTIDKDTTLYAQWQSSKSTLTIKVQSDESPPFDLKNALIKLSVKNGDTFDPVESEALATDAYGRVVFPEVLTDALYRVEQTRAPTGYLLPQTPTAFYFKIVQRGAGLGVQLYDEWGNAQNAPTWLTDITSESGSGGTLNVSFIIKNPPERFPVLFKNTRKDGNAVKGAGFKLERSDVVIPGVLKDASGTDGVFSVYGARLPYGTYTLIQTTTPENYEPVGPIIFEIGPPDDATPTGVRVLQGADVLMVSGSQQSGHSLDFTVISMRKTGRLEIEKKVTGNAYNPHFTYEFEVSAENLTPNSSYNIRIPEAFNYNGTTIFTFTANKNGKTERETVVTMRYVTPGRPCIFTFDPLPDGAVITIKEKVIPPHAGIVPTLGIDAGGNENIAVNLPNREVKVTIVQGQNSKATFTNNYNYEPLTGYTVSYLPYAALLGAVVLLVWLIRSTSRGDGHA